MNLYLKGTENRINFLQMELRRPLLQVKNHPFDCPWSHLHSFVHVFHISEGTSNSVSVQSIDV